MSWYSNKELGSLLWLKIARAIFLVLGYRWFTPILYPIAGFFFLTAAKQRRATIKFLKRALPPEKRGFLRLYLSSFLMFAEFAIALFHKFCIWEGRREMFSFSVQGRENLRSLISRKQGCVMLSAHMGNLEIMRAVSEDLEDVIVRPMMFTKHTPAFLKFLNSANPEWKMRVIASDRFSPQVIFEMKEQIKNGEVTAVYADRVMPGSLEKKVSCDFFGEKCEFPAGPFVLAYLLECPVLLAFCFREGNTYKLIMEEFSERIDLPRKGRHEALTEYVSRYAARVEHFARQYPQQWYNFYDLWDGRAHSR